MSSSISPRKTIAANKDIVNLIQRFSSKLSKHKGITLIVWSDERDLIRQFQLSGHAGFAEAGQDIVCAGVSAVAITAINGLEHFLTKPLQVEEDDGYLSCALGDIQLQELISAQWILKTMVLGLESIQEAYGYEYLTIEWRRWTPC